LTALQTWFFVPPGTETKERGRGASFPGPNHIRLLKNSVQRANLRLNHSLAEEK